MNHDEIKFLTDKAESNKQAARRIIENIPVNHLSVIVEYLRSQHALELASCATQENQTKLFRAQGSAHAISNIIALLSQREMSTRRSTSRREV